MSTGAGQISLYVNHDFKDVITSNATGSTFVIATEPPCDLTAVDAKASRTDPDGPMNRMRKLSSSLFMPPSLEGNPRQNARMGRYQVVSAGESRDGVPTLCLAHSSTGDALEISPQKYISICSSVDADGRTSSLILRRKAPQSDAEWEEHDAAATFLHLVDDRGDGEGDVWCLQSSAAPGLAREG
jgi:hypothetical protein